MLAKFGLCLNCSKKLDARARKIFATAGMLRFSFQLHVKNTRAMNVSGNMQPRFEIVARNNSS